MNGTLEHDENAVIKHPSMFAFSQQITFQFTNSWPLHYHKMSDLNIGRGFGLSSTQRVAYSISYRWKPKFGQTMPRNDWTSMPSIPRHLNCNCDQIGTDYGRTPELILMDAMNLPIYD